MFYILPTGRGKHKVKDGSMVGLKDLPISTFNQKIHKLNGVFTFSPPSALKMNSVGTELNSKELELRPPIMGHFKTVFQFA